MATGGDSSYSRPRISPGTRLNGIYEVGTLIATGGMGEIYKGQAIQTGDPVAIKLMLPEFAENESALALFRREASALHHLQHDAIVRYYVFTVEPILQRPYLAMEFVDGRSLSDILEQDGPLSFEAVRGLFQRTAAGLQAAHERGIIHRDVSPDNIIIPGSDVARAKIIDFGIARSTQLGEGTVIGSGFAGKYNYVSPEQLGLFGGDVTAKSDIYSLGLVLVQALTGRPLDMGGSQFQIVEKRRTLPQLGGIDMRWRPLLERMLQPNPADRPTSMAACVDDLVSVSPRPSVTMPAARASYEQPPKKSRWGVYTLGAAVLVAVLAGVSYPLLTMDVWPTPPQPLPPPTPASSTDGPSPAGPPPATAPTPVPAPAPVPVPAPLSVKPAPAPNPIENIKGYIKQYNGGDCFFVTPVAVGDTNASLEGFGATTAPFEALDQAFRKKIGFAADIGVRQVTQQQCPAINFLAQLADSPARSPRIDIDKTRLTARDALSGSIDQYGNRSILAFLVGPRGTMISISLQDGIDAKKFTVRIPATSNGSEPVLLMAIAGRRLDNSMRLDKPPAEFFSGILNEAKRTNDVVSVAVRYLRVEP